MTRRLAVVAAAVALAAPPVHAGPAGARGVTATAAGGSVTVSGWATFSGTNVASGKSPTGNAGVSGGQVGADLTYTALTYRPETADFYVRWQVTKLPSTSGGVTNVVGNPSIVYGLRTALAGVAVEIRVQSTGTGALYHLYKCDAESACVLATTLDGSFGSTGEEVTVTLSMATLAGVGLAVKEGDRVATPIVYTASAPIAAGVVSPALYVDSIVTGKAATVTVPAKSVRVTAGKVTKPAVLRDGYFSAAFPRSSFTRNPTSVRTRTCLGTRCVTQTFAVRH